MKLVLGFLAVVALASASPYYGRPKATYGLQEDLNEFAALIPVNDVISVSLDYLMNDAEVQEVFEYVQSDDFKQLVQDVESQKEYINFLNYLQDSGLDVYGAINKLHDFLGLPPLKSALQASTRRGQGVRGLIDDIKALLPLPRIKALYYEKLQTSPAFAALVERMRSDEIKNTVKAMINNPKLQEIVQRAKDHGVDVKLVIDILNKIFGWGLEETRFSAVTYGLKQDLNDFAALIPVNDIVPIALDYLMNDAEVQEAFEYVQSDDFKQLVQDVESQKEYINFLNYLQASGLDVYAAVNKLHDFLGLPPLSQSMRSLARRGQGVRGLIDDIKAILPLDKIKALYYEKLQTSPDFAALVERMRSDEIKNTVKAMINNPKLQEIVQRAKDHGVDVKLVIDILNKIFGWGLEETRFSAVTYGLKQDLNDFAALIPVNDIVPIALDYLMNDAEVQEAFEYVQSDDFKQLVQDVEGQKEYINFLNYLQASGLDVYAAVNKLHDFLGLPPLSQSMRSLARRGQGVRGLIDDIKAILPLDKIKALYYEKLQTSPDFAALVERMRSDEIKNTVKAMINNPKLQEIVQRAKEHGVDVKLVIDILNKIFGWGLEEIYSRAVTYNLKDDLNDFMALIPVNDILNVALDYVFNDEEVQEVIEYIQSDESIALLRDVEAVPEFGKMMNYFQDSGLDVYKALGLLHQFLGIPPFQPPRMRRTARGTGVRGLIDDIEALLPLDQIEAMYNDKLTSSPDFAAFVQKMKTDEIKGTVKDLLKNPKVQDFIQKAKDHKVDIKLVFDILNKIFGWGLE